MQLHVGVDTISAYTCTTLRDIGICILYIMLYKRLMMSAYGAQKLFIDLK